MVEVIGELMKVDVFERQKIDRYTPLRWLGFTLSGAFVVALLITVKVKRWYNYLIL